MSQRNGDRSRHDRMAKAKRRRRENIAALRKRLAAGEKQ